MPDELLNSLPGERKMTVLHQMAYNGGDHGVEPALRALVAGGCRFDPDVRTPMSADPAERNMTPSQIARDRGHAHIAELMSQLPDLAQQTKWRYYKEGAQNSNTTSPFIRHGARPNGLPSPPPPHAGGGTPSGSTRL